jgi:ferredoxin like protein
MEVGEMTMKVEDKLFLDRFRVDEESHLVLEDPERCAQECQEQPCLYLCPANVYRLEEGRMTVNYEGCLECGSCRIACPHLNIRWRFPRGGYGISHKFG